MTKFEPFPWDLVMRVGPASDCQTWIIDEDFRYQFLDDGAHVTITIKSGATTDGASIPPRLWHIIGPPIRARHVFAAVIHDMLYASEYMSRSEADRIFRRALIDSSAGSPMHAWIMYAGVRIGGAAAWKRHTAESIEEARHYIHIHRQSIV